MTSRTVRQFTWPWLAALCVVATAPHAGATPPGKFGFHVVHMAATGAYRSYAADTYGGGAEVAFSMPFAPDYVAWDLGTEFVNFNRADLDFRDPISGLAFRQSTSQSYLRVYTGLQAGLLRNRVVQPFVSAHVSFAEHNVRPVIQVPDDLVLEDQVMFRVDDEGAEWGVGFDVAAGIHVPLFQEMGVYGGLKYVDNKTIEVRRGQEVVDADPAYIQAFLGIAYDFGFSHAIE